MDSHTEKTPAATRTLPIGLSLPPSRPSFQASLAPTQDDNTSSGHPSPSLNAQNPCSAFYSHPATRLDLQQQRSCTSSRTHLASRSHDLDLEAGVLSPSMTFASQQTLAGRPSGDGFVQECSQWPTKATTQEKVKAAKRENRLRRGKCSALICSAGTGRSCGCWTTMSKRQRMWIKIALAIFVVGVAIGVGVGISKAVGGGVYTSNSSQQQQIS